MTSEKPDLTLRTSLNYPKPSTLIGYGDSRHNKQKVSTRVVSVDVSKNVNQELYKFIQVRINIYNRPYK